MIIIKLQGGLGNQMFQFALASIIAKKNKSLLKIDTNSFDSNIEGITPREFELSIFDNSYKKALFTEIENFQKSSFVNKLKKKLGLNYTKVFRESNLRFNDKVLKLKSPIYLEGYFQSYKYFLGEEGYVENIFSFPKGEIEGKNIKFLSDIENNNSTGVHIRRGDYLNDKETQEFHGNCGKEYYSKAIDFFEKQNEDVTFVFFSDDIEWVKNEFNYLDSKKIFIVGNTGENNWIDLFLMSSCSHQIIANSSFSWWSAWLNKNKNKKVIAPKNWFANEKANKDANDLIPSSWIRF
tara:strand:+ start:727 stop:1608 length:882 start_codon:yes stop_codon:yes gene_type:complete